MLFREVILTGDYCVNHKQHTSTQRGRHAGFLNTTISGTYCNR